MIYGTDADECPVTLATGPTANLASLSTSSLTSKHSASGVYLGEHEMSVNVHDARVLVENGQGERPTESEKSRGKPGFVVLASSLIERTYRSRGRICDWSPA